MERPSVLPDLPGLPDLHGRPGLPERPLGAAGLAASAAGAGPSAAWPSPDLQAPEGPASSLPDGSEDALHVLLGKMRKNSDFPSLSRAVTRIQQIAGSDTESLASLSSEILKDVALTQKLLRMVNTVHFKHLGGGGINTVSRAVALVGFAGIRNMALSLVLLEGMRDKQQADRLRDEFVRSLLAAQLASDLTQGVADAEEAYLAALFHNLGRLLTEFYLPDEAQAIEQLCQRDGATGVALAPESASRRVLGLGFEALGLGVAKSWGLPEGLRLALRRPVGSAPLRPVRPGSERHRWLAALANDLAWAMQLPDMAAARRQVRQLAQQHARALDCDVQDIFGALDHARLTLASLAPAMGLPVRPGSVTQRLLNYRNSDEQPLLPRQTDMSGPGPDTVPATVQPPSTTARDAMADMLAAGIQDVMSTLASDHLQLNAVLRMVLETLLRALHLRRVVFCLRDPATQHITGRFGLGPDVERVAACFDIPARAEAGAAVDLFSAVCIRAVDTVIADARDPALHLRLPAWYGPDVAAPSFLLLPLVMKGATFGLIYADASHEQALVLAEREMSLVRTLRSQAVMAFRQAA